MGAELQRHIRRDHPALDGHFPGNPLVPGVVLLTELLGILERESDTACGPVTLTSVKFIRQLRPGEPFTVRRHLLADQNIAFAVAREEEIIAAGTVRCAGLVTQVGS